MVSVPFTALYKVVGSGTMVCFISFFFRGQQQREKKTRHTKRQIVFYDEDERFAHTQHYITFSTESGVKSGTIEVRFVLYLLAWQNESSILVSFAR